jgi:hypothetical protein
MRVRLLTAISGPEGSWAEGDVYDCDAGTARRLIEAGYAVPVSVGGMELAVTDAPERAVKPNGKRRV